MSKSVVHKAKSLDDLGWLKRGRVRLFPINQAGQPPPLTDWEIPRLGVSQPAKKSSTASSSMATWQDRKLAKEKRLKERWREDQRLRRRLWEGTADESRKQLDISMDDEGGYESWWIAIKAKKGCNRWCWTHRRLKGAIEVEKPSGEVFLRGSKENQFFLRELVKGFTEDYHGQLPKMKVPPRIRPKRNAPAKIRIKTTWRPG